jgi:uncharacterized membrane protein YfbV (UPF0208 family)
MSILILSLPIHAFFLLGQQASERLPSGLRSWYREIEHQLEQKEELQDVFQKLSITKSKADNKLTYMDLAKLLKALFDPK